jgi:SAM-dependent methyltransferase
MSNNLPLAFDQNDTQSKLSFSFACPICQTQTTSYTPDEQQCPRDGRLYIKEEGIWRFLIPERKDYFWQFIHEYETVRRAEGRGSIDPNYYRSLPYSDLTRRWNADWQIRAQSFRTLLNRVLEPLEIAHPQPLKIMDIGSGNGWLAYRLAQRKHQVAAVDLLTNVSDGLGAHIFFDTFFVPVQAEYDRLPFTSDQIDLVIFNASFHYSTDYIVTLREAQRVLKAEGQLIILDSPVYHDPSSGVLMVHEREANFKEQYGFASNAMPSQNYLTFQHLDELAAQLAIEWQFISPAYNWRWTIRSWKTRLFNRREPAKFLLIIGKWIER